jgi:hypothetical protein
MANQSADFPRQVAARLILTLRARRGSGLAGQAAGGLPITSEPVSPA